jgi:Fe-S-cluster containining protein
VPHVDVKFVVDAKDRSVEASVRLPQAPVRPVELLPVLLSFADAVTGISESRAAECGETVTCRAGCGACCRQLVPVSETEALHLAAVVAAMPEPRRTDLTERFRQASQRAAPALAAFHAASGEAAVEEIGKAASSYFALGIPCPFLEQESCSIHPHRPAICREYLVISPAEHCARLDLERIKRIDVPVPVSSTLLFFSDGRGTPEPGVLPLIEALDWAAQHADQAPPEIPAPEMFRNFLRRFRGSDTIE